MASKLMGLLGILVVWAFVVLTPQWVGLPWLSGAILLLLAAFMSIGAYVTFSRLVP